MGKLRRLAFIFPFAARWREITQAIVLSILILAFLQIIDRDRPYMVIDPSSFTRSSRPRQDEKGLPMFPDEAVEECPFRPPGEIGCRCCAAKDKMMVDERGIGVEFRTEHAKTAR